MSVDNVRFLENGIWSKITPEEASKKYKYSVSVDNHAFLCYSCFHYVSFINKPASKGGSKKPYFAHSRGDTDKECEDRSQYFEQNRIPYLKSTLYPPMRLIKDGPIYGLELGLLPLSRSEITVAHNLSAEVVISSGEQSSSYCIEASRFIPGATTWIPVPFSTSHEYKVRTNPENIVKSIWHSSSPAISKYGTLFDGKTGRRISCYNDIFVSHPYLLLVNRSYSPGSCNDVSIKKLCDVKASGLLLYHLQAEKLSDNATSFFLNYHVLLTAQPTQLIPLWPPLQEAEIQLLNTNHRYVWVLQEGDGEIEGFPIDQTRIQGEFIFSSVLRLHKIINVGTGTQMVWIAKKSVLQYMYFRPMEDPIAFIPPEVSVTDQNDQPIPDLLSAPPPSGMLSLDPTVDGKAQVFYQDDLLYEVLLQADVTCRLQNLQRGQHIIIRLGLDVIREIWIQHKQLALQETRNSHPWREQFTPFNRRHAWMLDGMELQSDLYQRTLTALQQGYIPTDGLATLRKRMEEKVRGR